MVREENALFIWVQKNFLLLFLFAFFLILSFSLFSLNKNVFTADLASGNPSYNSDPQNLADGQHVLFVDQSNPNCSNSFTRAQALNPDTPWCDTGVFSNYSARTFGLLPGDNILFKVGIYSGSMYIADKGTPDNYIVFKPYPGDIATISGFTKTGWSLDSADSSGNKIYSIPYEYSQALVKRDGYGINNLKTLDELYNPPTITATLDTAFYDSSAKKIYVRLVSGTTDDIFFAGGVQFNIQTNGQIGYTEITGFNIQYAYDGIKLQEWYGGLSAVPGIKIIDNNISHIWDQGVLGRATNLIISGNTISYTGTPLQYGYDGKGSLIKNNKDHSLYISGGSGEIANNNLTKCYGICLTIDGDYSVYSNYTEGAETDSAYESTHSIIYNNIIIDNFYDYGATSVKFYNNLILGVSDYFRGNEVVYIGPNSIIDFKNNIVSNTGFCNDVDNINFSSSIIDYNLYTKCVYGWFLWDDSVKDTVKAVDFNSYQTKIKVNNPLYEKSSLFTTDVKLNGTLGLLADSPAIGKGVCLSQVAKDYFGKFRPTGTGCDIGPFQYGSSSTPPPTCGDGSCNGSETCSSCSADCGACCTPNWQTGAWSVCASSSQTRTVTDSNSCNITTDKPATSQSCTSACSPNWKTGTWSACASSSQTRTVTDSNSCNITTDKPATSQSCTSACSPNWKTGAWSVCANSFQRRTVTDLNNCNVTTDKPATSQSCINHTPEPTLTPIQISPNISCDSNNWQCSDQGACINSEQIKKCIDLKGCSEPKIIKIYCSLPAPDEENLYMEIVTQPTVQQSAPSAGKNIFEVILDFFKGLFF